MAEFLDRFRRFLMSAPEGRDRPPSVPPGLILYAIGDIHGEWACLTDLLDLIREDEAAQPPGLKPVVLFLGDYIDRGPNSRKVVDFLSGQPLPGFRTRFLRGNHEQALLDFLRDPLEAAPWLEFGGLSTLDSYGVRMRNLGRDRSSLLAARDELAQALPARHLAWLQRLELYAAYGDYLFVHAGIRPGIALEEQSPDDLLTIRTPFLTHRRPHAKRVVHGHTISPAPEILANRIGIDTGAYASGVLTAVALRGETIRILQSRPENRCFILPMLPSR